MSRTKIINLSDKELARFEYGKSQFPWFTSRIDKIIKKPTEHRLKLLRNLVDGGFVRDIKAILESNQ